MAINLNSSAAQAAVNNVQNAEQNKNKAADGFEDGMDLSFDDLMSEYNATNFGTSTDTDSNAFGGTQTLGQNLMGPVAFGGVPSTGTNMLGQGMNGLGINNQLGQLGGQTQPAPRKITATDVLSDGTTAAVKATGSVLKDFVKSLQGVTCDDLASLSVDVLTTGLVLAGLATILFITSVNGNITIRAFARLFMPTGLLQVGLSLIGISLTGFGIISKGEPEQSLAVLPDTPVQLGTQSLSMDALDAEYDALLDSFYDDDDDMEDELSSDTDDNFFNATPSSNAQDDWGDFFGTTPSEPEQIQANNDDLLENMNTNVAKIDRAYLLDQFSRLLPKSCTTFGQTVEVEKDSQEFNSVRSLLLQALSNASKLPIEELPVDLEKLESSTFSYTMTVGRLKGISKLQDLADEIQVYFRENANDTGVIASIEVEHGYYKISLTKGISEMVTVRDCLEQKEVRTYFENTKNLLPFIVGIDTYGNPVLASGENYTAMLTAGKQRSGKSWYITSVLMTLMTFNPPTDVMFLFIDPKKSSLYRAFSCVPHTIGVHDDEDIIGLLRYVVDVEGERRKERLRAANKGYGVDSIKDYRKEGHTDMPYLYIVIDEYLTAIANAEQKGVKKELDNLINTVITQLPFVGIHLWLIAHRAQGAISKTARANIMFTSAFRCENNIVEEVLDTKWTRPLKNPGDMAVKLQDIGKEMFARAAVFTTSDEDNTRVIKDIAKAWYKIGADVPNVDYGMLANKDFDYISAMLGLDDEQTRTLKIAAVGKSNNTQVINPGQSGMMDDAQFAATFRQSNSNLDEFLSTDDEEFISTAVTQQTQSNDTDLDDDDEDMLARWRQTLAQEESTAPSSALSGWEDESTIFDD